GHSLGHGVIRILVCLDLVSAVSKISLRAMGFSRDPGNLVCELPACLHVLQPVVVPCPFCFCGGAVRLVLEPHARRPLVARMGHTGSSGRPHDRCLSPERNSPNLSSRGIFIHLLAKTNSTRFEIIGPRISKQRGGCSRGFRGVSADAHHQENNLWQFPQLWLWR